MNVYRLYYSWSCTTLVTLWLICDEICDSIYPPSSFYLLGDHYHRIMDEVYLNLFVRLQSQQSFKFIYLLLINPMMHFSLPSEASLHLYLVVMSSRPTCFSTMFHYLLWVRDWLIISYYYHVIHWILATNFDLWDLRPYKKKLVEAS